MKYSKKVGNGPMNKWLHFDGDPDHGSGYRSVIWIRIRVATLARRALAEVCTVPVLLVMVALCNRADHIYFHPVSSSSSFFFFLA